MAGKLSGSAIQTGTITSTQLSTELGPVSSELQLVGSGVSLNVSNNAVFSGNVGIGTTSPSSFNSSGLPLVVGSGTGNNGLTIYSGSTSTGFFNFADGTAGNDSIRGRIGFDHSNNSLQFFTDATERLRINSTGSVGIGTNDPGAKLSLTSTGNTAADGIRLTFGSEARSHNIYSSLPTGRDLTIAPWRSIAIITGNGIAEGIITLNSYEYTVFGTGSTGTERMRLDSIGVLNIGQTASVGVGATPADVNSTEIGRGYINLNRDDTADVNQIQFGKNGAIAAALGTGASDLRFKTGGSTERMRIDSSGNLGLGVTPSAWGGGNKAIQVGVTGAFWNYSAGGTQVSNNYAETTGSVYIQNGYATTYVQEKTAGTHAWYNAPSGTAGNTATFTQVMTLEATGGLAIGRTSTGGNATDKILAVEGTGSAQIALFYNNTNGAYLYSNQFNTVLSSVQNLPLLFSTNNTEKMRITSGGNVGIGTTSPESNAKLTVKGAGIAVSTDSSTVTPSGFDFKCRSANAKIGIHVTTTGQTATLEFGTASDNSNGAFINVTGADPLRFGTNNIERARIDSSGNFLVSTSVLTDVSSSGTGNEGAYIRNDGQLGLAISNETVIIVNRKSIDGTLIDFRQDGASEGSISVSGSTVSYNNFSGSHASQLQDGSKPDILRGTVMESINELCEWEGEENERLPKCKISDTAGSKKVYGVFMAWDNDWETTNDMYVTAVGAFVCRVNADVTVQEGDLLESNGDGTARVQADDLIRSSTIGKVTSTVKTHEYDDGSYCVPTVLYCG